MNRLYKPMHIFLLDYTSVYGGCFLKINTKSMLYGAMILNQPI